MSVNMNQTNSYEVVVKNSAQAVIVPLKGCIGSLNGVIEALMAEDIHPDTGYCSNYDYIRQQIVQAWQSLEHSDQAATACLKRLDKTLENLMCEEGTLEWQKNDTNCSLDNLRTEQASNEKLLKESQGALEQAETHQRSTEETLQRQERRVENAKKVADVGLRLCVIPFVGWAFGATLIVGSTLEMTEASYAIKSAEEVLQKFKNQVDNYTHEVSGHKSKILHTHCEIVVMDQRLKQIRNDIYVLKKQRQSVAELQLKARSNVHALSVLSGRVNVLEQHTRRFILYESVLKVMEEVMKSTEEITRNELLCTEDVVESR